MVQEEIFLLSTKIDSFTNQGKKTIYCLRQTKKLETLIFKYQTEKKNVMTTLELEHCKHEIEKAKRIFRRIIS